ncbi:tRNA-2-methylthio-N(6)-dimethylallyladenosine synthase [Buchnera aphidicola (Tetraneura ulmi)]|uniref:tRNA (N6-isopentenyl adenosine(37)-C2)-methylthiotransferase MiaB n=1 Tax=Buchnera aphidicola TaxID=9 RepID=UPI00346439F3
MNKKFYIKTWGCQMNEYDSELIEKQLTTKKYKITKNPEKADILILNTCSIREKAQEKVFHQLGRWKKIKKKKPNTIIAVGGCVATQEGKKIYKRANYINIVFGTQTLHKLSKMIEMAHYSNNLIIDISFNTFKKFKIKKETKIIKKKISSFVSIMEGCNKYCSFCIVPFTRGKEISRPVNHILKEIKQLSENGVREINLLGQNVNSYLGIGRYNKMCKFSELLQMVAEINGIDRIRFTTSNPFQFTDDIINVYKTTKKIVNFLHLPIQSGSNRILKKMKRLHTIQEYKEIVNKLINIRKNIQISSDFIVGFPGETEQDFLETIKIIEEIKFDMSFSFIYSKRPGTPASKMKDLTSIQEKKERLYFLQKKINEQTLFWSKKMLNKKKTILVEKESENKIFNLKGKTENNRNVFFKGEKKLIGNFTKVKITSFSTHNLYGYTV